MTLTYILSVTFIYLASFFNVCIIINFNYFTWFKSDVLSSILYM